MTVAHHWRTDHELRGIARMLIRRAPTHPLEDEKTPVRWSMIREVPWTLGLAKLTRAGAEVHWFLAVYPMDNRARFEHLPGLLTRMGVPDGTAPLVSAADTPAGEALYWLWRPHDPGERHAPKRTGSPALAEVRELIRGRLVASYAAIAATRAEAQAAERRAAEVAREAEARARAEFVEQLANAPEPMSDDVPGARERVPGLHARGDHAWDEERLSSRPAFSHPDPDAPRTAPNGLEPPRPRSVGRGPGSFLLVALLAAAAGGFEAPPPPPPPPEPPRPPDDPER